MNILFLYISLPHLSQPGVFSGLIKEFAKQGHQVKVAVPLQSGKKDEVNIEEGIEVLRFKTGKLTNNVSNIEKGLNYMRLSYQYPRAIKKHFGKEKFDLIITHSLPTEIGIIANRLKRRYRAPFYLMLCEYIWQDSVAFGFFSEKSLICKYYQWLEKIAVKSADYIGSPSQGNIAFAQKYHPTIKEKNIRVLHYTQEPIEVERKDSEIRSKYGLSGKFVAIYGGNMSIAQKIENVINVAEACLDYDDIIFLLLGRGQEVEQAKVEVNTRNLTNIKFVDFLPQQDYLQLLASCDVGLVSLNEKLAIPNIPSKTLSYFNLKIPVVASIDRSTDYGEYLEKAGGGLWSYAGDTEYFKQNILKLYHDAALREKMGENGFRFYWENMRPVNAYETIIGQTAK